MGCPALDHRTSLRFDVVFPVLISADGFRTRRCIARNISSGGMFLETGEPLPLGLSIRVHFIMDGSQGEIVAKAQVKNQYYLKYADGPQVRSVVGMGIKFIEFERDTDETFRSQLTRFKTLH